MLNQPLQPFDPSALFAKLNFFGTLSESTIVIWALYAVFAFWALYTLVAIYHWLKYSHASWVAFPAIAVHLFVSLAIISYALYGNVPFLTSYL